MSEYRTRALSAEAQAERLLAELRILTAKNEMLQKALDRAVHRINQLKNPPEEPKI